MSIEITVTTQFCSFALSKKKKVERFIEISAILASYKIKFTSKQNG